METVETLIIGCGQAGLAMSEHLRNHGQPHLIVERKRIAERWRTERWDSLVANGPAWHDRFASMEFAAPGPDDFASKDEIVAYFEGVADRIEAPIRCNVNVTGVEESPDGFGFLVETSSGLIRARNVVAATGPFQKPIIPTLVPEDSGITQIHSNSYRNPEQLPDGAVFVVGAGSSGSQIADELLRSGREVYLSVGPHDRPPRSYRGKDFVWWLGALGKWEAKAAPAAEHVTIAVSGAHGGRTVDFRRFAARGMTLVGRTEHYTDGTLFFAPDLADNIRQGDKNYLSVLQEADDHIARHNLGFPEEPEAHLIDPDPDCMTNPILELNLADARVSTIIWATGYALDFSWIKLDSFTEDGKPLHHRGVSDVPGLYFLGLPWLSMRGSSFIWGVWEDAKYLAQHIASRGSEPGIQSAHQAVGD